MSSVLAKEFNYYLANQDEMVRKYDGKVVVIKDLSIIGVYPTELDAVVETQKTHEVGTFLIQKVSKGNEGYTHTFHSRAVFS